MHSYIEKVSTFIVCLLVSATASLSVSAANIGTAAEFTAAITGDPTGTHTLTADIELSGWVPCAFSGTLDGAGHKITGLTGALFSNLTGIVKDLSLQGSATEIAITADADFGVLAVVASGATVSGCTVSGFKLISQQVTKTIYPGMGFFVGRAYDGCMFSNCSVESSCSATVGINVFCGGIVGRVDRSTECTVTELATFHECVNWASCYSASKVSAVGNGAFGGILGIFAKTAANVASVRIERCKNHGDLTLSADDNSIAHTFGGIVGKYEGSGATNGGNTLFVVGCENNGSYRKESGSSKNAVFGGVIGLAGRYGAKVDIDRCINNGNAVATGSTATTGCYFGGFIGYFYEPTKNNSSVIKNSINRGSISLAGSCSGSSGAIGYIKFVTTTSGTGIELYIRNCSFEGTITGADNTAQIAYTSSARSGTLIYVDNCWVADNSERLHNGGNITYTETNLQIHSPGGDAAECAALNAVASGVAEYLSWKVNATTAHPEPAMPFMVRFVDWDDTLLKAELVDEGGAATAPDDPVRSGFVFGGWDPADFTHVTADMTIRAYYNCTVTFKNWDGVVFLTDPVREGTPVAKPETHPAKQNHEFAYWSLNDVEYDFSLPVSGDLTLVAVFTINTYPVRFFDWTDTQIGETQYVQHGKAAAAPALPPIPEGMTFKRWDTDFSNVTKPLDVHAIMGIVRDTVWVSVGGMDAEGRGTMAAPYATVAYAVSSLDQEDGGTVYVTPGTYLQKDQTRLDAPIRVVGTTGNPADVILQNKQNDSSQRDRLFRINHAGAFVANLTMLDGNGTPDGSDANNYHNGGAFTIREPGGVVSNCVIRNGSSLHFSSRGAGAYLYNGLVTHCVFTGKFSTCPAYNANPSAEGVVIHCNGTDARIENTLIYDAIPVDIGKEGRSHGPIVAIIKGLMRNCTVVPNVQLSEATVGGENKSKYDDPWNTDGGCAIRCGTGGRVENCAVAGLMNIKGELKPFGGTLANFYNCVGDGSMSILGSHNCKLATVDEMFIDPSAKDYRPRTLGALVNCALDVPGYGSLIDLAGMKRVVKLLDVGCYESQYVPGLVITGKRIDN